MIDLLDLVYEFGPAIGIILFFLGRDAAREERMAARIDKLEDVLIEMVRNETRE